MLRLLRNSVELGLPPSPDPTLNGFTQTPMKDFLKKVLGKDEKFY